MAKLALYGGSPAVSGSLRRYNSIGDDDVEVVSEFMRRVVEGKMSLSGYLGGGLYGGRAVQALEHRFKQTFDVRDAIACNSATSGLLAACMACGVKSGERVNVPPLSMSATAAAPKFLGGALDFYDVDETLCGDPATLRNGAARATLVTHLFGHPARMEGFNRECSCYLIEDAAQALFATENGRFAGTVGDIGVFSFNVHKQVNAGEGGMIVTNDLTLAMRMRRFINHGELGDPNCLGLNLRMSELTAVLAINQFDKAQELVNGRRKLRDKLATLIPEPFKPIPDRSGCVTAAYCLPIMAPDEATRTFAVPALLAEGIQVSQGYSPLLNDLQAFKHGSSGSCKRARDLEKCLLLIELCAIDPTEEQLEQIGEGFKKVAAYVGTHGNVASRDSGQPSRS